MTLELPIFDTFQRPASGALAHNHRDDPQTHWSQR